MDPSHFEAENRGGGETCIWFKLSSLGTFGKTMFGRGDCFPGTPATWICCKPCHYLFVQNDKVFEDLRFECEASDRCAIISTSNKIFRPIWLREPCTLMAFQRSERCVVVRVISPRKKWHRFVRGKLFASAASTLSNHNCIQSIQRGRTGENTQKCVVYRRRSAQNVKTNPVRVLKCSELHQLKGKSFTCV